LFLFDFLTEESGASQLALFVYLNHAGDPASPEPVEVTLGAIRSVTENNYKGLM